MGTIMSFELSHDGTNVETLSIATSRDRDEYVIELGGELDLSGVARVSEVFASALKSGAAGIVLDLRELEFLDSTGVHAILTAERSASARNRSFVIIRGSRQVQRIFEVSGVAGRLAFVDG
jgi:anti-sigma B factor antagonist